ncbi:hypothetical protein XM47_14895 [Catenovulum maritimum]|uniref:DNA repair protein RecO n=2 Tax=Catenovulum maritimum TaxID=1513271 RepID=A0A0J8GNA1_9ALTE|nr:hypothetical protein XM47_14895 [Catenovulum maritimum]
MQKAVVLHSRAYREGSYICQLLTEFDGRLTAIVRVGRNSAKFEPFNLYTIKLSQGRADLFFVDKYELDSQLAILTGKLLYSGLYINELLVKLLQQTLHSELILSWYIQVIYQLKLSDIELESVLRNFELDLIDELGVSVDFDTCFDAFEPIQADMQYQFYPEQGWSSKVAPWLNLPIFPGDIITKIGERDFSEVEILKSAKLLTRRWLDHLLAGKPIKSRELFKRMNR